MVHNGVHNMGACFNGYFYNYKFIVKFQGGLMYFVVKDSIDIPQVFERMGPFMFPCAIKAMS